MAAASKRLARSSTNASTSACVHVVATASSPITTSTPSADEGDDLLLVRTAAVQQHHQRPLNVAAAPGDDGFNERGHDWTRATNAAV